MKYISKITILITLACLVLWFSADQLRIQKAINENTLALCLWIGLIYILSHIARILRLGFLAVDQKKYIPELTKAHLFTAFPNLLMPFKFGEVLRFIYIVGVFQDRKKGICIWLVERLCDLVTITGIFFLFTILKVELPEPILGYLKVIAFSGLLVIFSIVTFSQVISYLSHYIILHSYSERGLKILEINSFFSKYETQILYTIKGRVLGLVFLTILIWLLEVLAIFLVLKEIDIDKMNVIKIFTESLLDSDFTFNSVSDGQYFGIYKALALAIFISLVLVFLVIRRSHNEN